MKGKGWIIIAVCLIISGVVIMVAALAGVDFDISKIGTQKFETNTYKISENFNNIQVDVKTTEITFKLSDNGECRVEFYEEEAKKHSAEVKNDTLIIKSHDSRKWYEFFQFGLWFESPKMTIYLPKAAYEELSIDTSTGNINIPEDFTFESVEVDSSTSNVECYASVSEKIEIDTSTGNIIVGYAKPETIDLSASTGNIFINDVECFGVSAQNSTGRIELKNVVAGNYIKAENSIGGVKFERCDADDIIIRTSTGNVNGTLLSGKEFFTDTSLGKVSVPESAGGGKCVVSTSTGNINIEIVK